MATAKGTLLAFAEGRKESRSDAGDIDIVLRRSRDRGQVWSDLQVVADNGTDTIGDPTPLVLGKSGTVLLLLTANPAKVSEARTVWITSSKDDGETWAPPREIISMAKKPVWGWYTTGPGNGIRLQDGRIVIPCDHAGKASKTMHSHVIHSNDGGTSWRIGASAGANTDESAVIERAEHDEHGVAKKRRALAVSRDRGATWSELSWDETLVEPVCQASLVRYDDAVTWPVARVVHEGPASYSSLAVLNDRPIGLLYQPGFQHFGEMLTFARFNIEWLRAGAQPGLKPF